MRKTRIALALAQLLAMAGCSLAPPYEVPKQSIPAAFKESGPWKIAAPADQILRGDWWKLFDDATLDSLERQVDSSSQDLAAAYARYREASAYEQEASSALYPTVQAFGSLTRNRQSDDRPLRSSHQPDYYGANTIGIGASYELDLWDRVHNLVATGKALSQASAADLESVRLALHVDLAAAYVRLRQLDSEIRLLNDTVASYRRQLTLIQNRFQGGIASAQDVARAQTQLEEAQTQVADSIAKRALLEHAIAALIGEPASTFSIAEATPTIATPRVPVGVPSTLLQRRPDIAAAERRVAASNAEIGVARAAFFPSITLGLQGGLQNTGALSLLALSNSFWSVGPAAALTLFDAGRRQAEVDRARAVMDETAARYRATVLQAFKEVEDNLAWLRQLQQEAASEQAAVTSAQKTRDLAMNRYREGAVSFLEVIVAEEAALRTERAALDINTRTLLASIGLIQALGGGWDGNLTPSSAVAAGSSSEMRN